MNKRLIGVMALVGAVALLVWRFTAKPQVATVPNMTNWKMYSTEDYRFSIKYPPELVADATEGQSNPDGRFMALDLGTAEQVSALKATTTGAGGAPIFLRVSASQPNNTTMPGGGLVQPGTCGDGFTLSEYVSIGGVKVAKCLGPTMGGGTGLLMVFDNGPIRYALRSDMYGAESKKIVDNIVSTFRFGP